ncbi:MAG TPA: hypothetical protein VFQ43_06260, partial [Nitrososphaera sp.]|nr:hypothetical protein [Nitrososphaera sp.]
LFEIDLTGIKHSVNDLQATVGEFLDVDVALFFLSAQRETFQFDLKEGAINNAGKVSFRVIEFLSDFSPRFG